MTDQVRAHRQYVESRLWMIKSKFGGEVRSKFSVAQVNEILAKILRLQERRQLRRQDRGKTLQERLLEAARTSGRRHRSTVSSARRTRG